MSEWTRWQPFPDPCKHAYLYAPFGPGVYELRHKSRPQDKILFGSSKNVAYRMSSLLARPLGAGHRGNTDKQGYVLEHLDDIEYRTAACANETEAKEMEEQLKAGGGYRYAT